MNETLALLLGVGGAGGLAGIFNIYLSWRNNKASREETLIQRLNSETKRQQDRADEAETDADKLRHQRDRAREMAAQYRSRLIALGENPPPADDLYS
jgi:hypothetical protein